ncbi:hypothetical protein EsH8_III_000656 [Colletotrichum jinshuiense]
MRLINVDTLEVNEFFGLDIPKYAILSHTWGEEEVSYQEYCWLREYEGNHTMLASLDELMFPMARNWAEKAQELRQRSGFAKIVQSVWLAKHWHILYLWIDTCCIDKTSSSELSEAINSMFSWYQRSYVCFAFLEDVGIVAEDVGGGNAAAGGWRIEHSKWFTRGWTLQELLAPYDVQFYDRDWKPLGSKRLLQSSVSRITGIPPEILINKEPLWGATLARRMSWASKRQTSRPEDMAYCLLGLFDINMPLLYGEGEKAFVRLQQEIIKDCADQSLFAWGLDRTLDVAGSIFATSPALLAGAGTWETEKVRNLPAFQMTNIGLQIMLRLLHFPGSQSETEAGFECYYAVLDVVDGEHNICLPLCTQISCQTGVQDGGIGGIGLGWSHLGPVKIMTRDIPHNATRRTVLISRDLPSRLHVEYHLVHIDTLLMADRLPGHAARLVETYPPIVHAELFTNSTLAFFPLRRGPNKYLMRFVVPNMPDKGWSEDSKMPKRQFVVVVDTGVSNVSMPDARGRLKMGARVVDWSEVPFSSPQNRNGNSNGNGNSSDGHCHSSGRFCSLAEAMLTDDRFLDNYQWDRGPPFCFKGGVLAAEAVTAPSHNANIPPQEVIEIHWRVLKQGLV